MEASNNAKLRDLAEAVAHMNDDGYWNSSASICALVSNAKAALAEPVKNCEVGTAEEQSERLHAYCKSHRCIYCSSGNGDECKFYRPGMKTDCKIEWANAPYKEGGDK